MKKHEHRDIRFPLRRSAIAVMIGALFAPAAMHAAPVSWLTNADGAWSTAANWSSNPLLPGASDDVTIDVGGATVRTVTFNTGTHTISSLASQENLIVSGGALTVGGPASNTATTTLQGGTLTLNGASSFANLTQSGGALTGTGAVTVTGSSTWSGGTMSGTGSTTFASGSTLDLSGNNGRTLTERTLNLAGTTIWTNSAASNGIISVLNAQINNSGLFRDQNAFNNAIQFSGGAPIFTNTGIYTKSGAGTTNIGIAFNNTYTGVAGTGVVNIDSGTLRLTGGSTSNGTFNIAAVGALELLGTNALNNVDMSSSTGRLAIVQGTTRPAVH